jgi:hypothetical protein
MTPTTTKNNGPLGRVRGGLWRAAWLLATPMVLLGAGGCSSAGTLWYEMFGNPDVPPVYTLSKSATLVLVENSHRQAGQDFDADLVAAQLVEELKHHDVCPLVDASHILQLRDTNPQQYLSMSISDLARTVGAKQVVYVMLEDATGVPTLDRPGRDIQAAARVRVVDATTGSAAWPLDNQAGYPISASVPIDAQGTQGTDAHTQALAKLSDAVGKLFYKYQPDSSDDDQTDKPHVMQDM